MGAHDTLFARTVQHDATIAVILDGSLDERSKGALTVAISTAAATRAHLVLDLTHVPNIIPAEIAVIEDSATRLALRGSCGSATRNGLPPPSSTTQDSGP